METLLTVVNNQVHPIEVLDSHAECECGWEGDYTTPLIALERSIQDHEEAHGLFPTRFAR